MNDAQEKEYEQRNRSVRITKGAIDPILWLRNQYTNDAGQMICQICKEENMRRNSWPCVPYARLCTMNL